MIKTNTNVIDRTDSEASEKEFFQNIENEQK